MKTFKSIDEILKNTFEDDIPKKCELKMEKRTDEILLGVLNRKGKDKLEIIGFLTPLKQLSFGLLSVVIMFIGVYDQLNGSEGKLSSNISFINNYNYILKRIELKATYKVNINGVSEEMQGRKVKLIITKNAVFRSVINKTKTNNIVEDFVPDKYARIKYLEFNKKKFFVHWKEGEKR